MKLFDQQVLRGSTTVNGGKLANGVDNALPTTTSLTINNGLYDLNGNNQTLSGSISGTNGTITALCRGLHSDP